jgi:hypothetical protein
MKTLTLDEHKIKQLDGATNMIHYLIGTLSPVVNHGVLDDMNKIESILADLIKPFREAEDLEEQEYQNLLVKIENELGIKRSAWSMREIKDFDGLYPVTTDKPHYLFYVYNDAFGKSKTVRWYLPSNFTWKDLWQASENLIIESDDVNHIFIEDISYATPKKALANIAYLELSTGS